MWKLYRAAIDHDGLQLGREPVASAKTLRAALALADDPATHGPEGVAIVSPSGRVIYTADEYEYAAARLRVAS